MSRKSKSLTKIFDLTAAKETSPFTAHCKKDMLEWLRVPRWPFAVFFYHLAKKKKKDGNIAKVLIILHHLTKFITHSWERSKYVTNHWETLQCILKNSNPLKMHFTLQQLSTALLKRQFLVELALAKWDSKNTGVSVFFFFRLGPSL